jgi:hypothetical protein
MKNNIYRCIFLISKMDIDICYISAPNWKMARKILRTHVKCSNPMIKRVWGAETEQTSGFLKNNFRMEEHIK